jgi:hypothetical protein
LYQCEVRVFVVIQVCHFVPFVSAAVRPEKLKLSSGAKAHSRRGLYTGAEAPAS